MGSGHVPPPTAQAREAALQGLVWWCTGEYGAPRLYPTVQLCDMVVRPKLPSWEETWRVFYLGFPRLAHAHRQRNI